MDTIDNESVGTERHRQALQRKFDEVVYDLISDCFDALRRAEGKRAKSVILKEFKEDLNAVAEIHDLILEELW